MQNRLLLASSILSPSALKKPAVSEIDSAFLENCKTIIKENILNPEFGYEQFFNHLNISKSNGYRKIKGLTGKSPGEYILIEKMKLAAELIAAKKYQPTQIAYEMGYNNPSNFTRDFKKVFHKTPREFL